MTDQVMCNYIEGKKDHWFCHVCGHVAHTTGLPQRKCGPWKKQASLQPSGKHVTKTRQLAPQSGPCAHRGELLRTQVCKPCQAMGKSAVEVFWCSLHSECTLSNTAVKPKIRACSTCSDWVELISLDDVPQ